LDWHGCFKNYKKLWGGLRFDDVGDLIDNGGYEILHKATALIAANILY